MPKSARYIVILLFSVVCTYSQSIGKPSISYQQNYSKPKLKKQRAQPARSFQLNKSIPEGSGMIAWDGHLWTHNDSGDAVLYKLDTVSGAIVGDFRLPVQNNDWEDMDQDMNYLYIGGFGNNTGRKDTLKIYRIEKQSLVDGRAIVDSISFVWPKVKGSGFSRKINFDCEAMAVINDTIILFTKEWKRNRCTKAFSIPALPGLYTASYITTFKTNVLISGASYHKDKKQLVLCGYSLFLAPRLFVFSNCTSSAIFTSPARKVKVQLPFRQVEAICSFDGIHYYMINEKSKLLFLYNEQQLHNITLDN